MSTGCFMGIRASYTDDCQEWALTFIEAANRALRARGLSDYADHYPGPDVYAGERSFFGRSALDHHGSSCLADLGRMAGNDRPHLALLAAHPYRLAFVPLDFPAPLETGYSEEIAGVPTPVPLGSSQGLLRDLSSLAGELGVPLEGARLADEVAAKINDFAPLRDGDPAELIEDVRTAWLLLYEGARLSVETGAALSLAG